MDALVEAVQKKLRSGPHDDHFGWLGSTVWIVTILFIYAQAAIGYTHGSLVGTLAMVESTSPTAIIHPAENKEDDALPAYTDDPDAPPPSYAREAVLLLTPTPITASNRGTVRHLQQVGGRGARFRGLGIAILYTFVTYHLFWLICLATGSFGLLVIAEGPYKVVGIAFSFTVTQLLMFRVNMLWTHIVISAPSEARMRARVVPWAQAKKVLLPTLGWALAHVAIPLLLIALTCALRIDRLVGKLDRTGRLEDREVVRLAGSVALVLAAAGVLLVTVYVPANVALTRCQAALLDPSETPIIPFDRTFAGRLDPDAPRRLRLRAAWASFDWNGRMRLAKVYLKTLAFQLLAIGAYVGSVIVLATAWVLL